VARAVVAILESAALAEEEGEVGSPG